VQGFDRLPCLQRGPVQDARQAKDDKPVEDERLATSRLVDLQIVQTVHLVGKIEVIEGFVRVGSDEVDHSLALVSEPALYREDIDSPRA
jgi:hypothetical protein